jgi:hypothetical protein
MNTQTRKRNPTTPTWRERLQVLADHGYQPMYNGRPSCPFCANFVDDEQTHRPTCSLIRALAEGWSAR